VIERKRVLVLADWYEPGFKAGGPIRSVVNFCSYLEHEFDLYILTTDRDLGDKAPYQDVERDKWVTHGAHKVYYASQPGWHLVREVIADVKPHSLFLNSMFSRCYSVYPLLMKRLGLINQKIILAPRGMLKPSALSIKSRKKRFFLTACKVFGLHKQVGFLATDEAEESDIRKTIEHGAEICTIGNLPGKLSLAPAPIIKSRGELKVLFIGRIHAIKNLHFLLQSLKGLQGSIELSIVGTLEDSSYWTRCEKIVSEFSGNIKVRIFFDVPHKLINDFLRTSHIFAMPTRGENFGHAIFEALALGRPVLISDQTPWRRLKEAKAGWDLPIVDISRFSGTLQGIVEMDQDVYEIWSKGAWEFAKNYIERSDLVSKYIKQFS
jgi:glycosyltransferase involved in cell wall biosynthesis